MERWLNLGKKQESGILPGLSLPRSLHQAGDDRSLSPWTRGAVYRHSQLSRLGPPVSGWWRPGCPPQGHAAHCLCQGGPLEAGVAIKEQNHLPSKTVLKAAFIPDASIPWFARPPAPLLPPSGSLQAHLPVPLLTAARAHQPPAGTRAGHTASLLKVPSGRPPTACAAVAQEGRLPTPRARASGQLRIISRPSRQSAQRPGLVSYFSSHNGAF